jgi:hypothetical protein
MSARPGHSRIRDSNDFVGQGTWANITRHCRAIGRAGAPVICDHFGAYPVRQVRRLQSAWKDG